MSMVVLRGNHLWIKLGLVFIESPIQKNSKGPNATLTQKKGNIHTQINSHMLKLIFCDSFGKLCNLRQWCHNYPPSTWIYTTNTWPTKNSSNECLGYVHCVWCDDQRPRHLHLEIHVSPKLNMYISTLEWPDEELRESSVFPGEVCVWGMNHCW